MLRTFLLAFIPLFVALDPVGMGVLFLSLAEGHSPLERRRIAWQATITALVITIGFMLVGRFIFAALGITIADFQIAGGLILLLVATRSLLELGSEAALLPEDFGVVPLGLPIIAGPALLSTVLVLMDTVGVVMTVAALAANFALLVYCMVHSQAVIRVLGRRGAKAVSKLIGLLLVAIAVNMIRRGVQSL